MNDFRRKKIRHAPLRKPISEKAKQTLATILGILLLIIAFYYGAISLIDKLSNTRLIEFVADVIGKDLKTDENGHTNILFLGVGGEGHEGADLTDTVMLTSIDHATNHVSLISLPRDLYVESDVGASRINRLYETGKIKWESEEGLELVRKTVENITALPVPYYVKVDFEAFEKIIDELGGIDIFVEQTIDDKEYPKDKTYEYEPFYIEKGSRHLDGKTALKYARSRKTSSDFDRSKRQQQVLLAVKNKAAQENMFSRKSLLKQIYYEMEDHVETNLTMREMLTLADFAVQWDSKHLSSATLNDEPIFRGGFLYTPLRELYGGAYILLPAGDNFDSVKHFIQLVFYGPYDLDNIPIAILNGTKQNGLAGTARKTLHRFGFAIAATSNARNQDLETTTYYALAPEAEPLAKFLQNLIPGEISGLIPAEYQPLKLNNAKLIIELGATSAPVVEKLDVFRNVVELKPSSNATGTTSTPSATAKP